VLEFQPGSVEALRTLARGTGALRRSAEAIQAYHQLALVDTLSADDDRLLGKAYAANGQDSLAAVSFGLRWPRRAKGRATL